MQFWGALQIRSLLPGPYKDLYSKILEDRRNAVNLTQKEFADRAGVALTFVRKIEQGKTNLNMEKVNIVLSRFGNELAPVKSKDSS